MKIIFLLGTIWDWVTSLLGIVGIFGVTNFKLESIGVYITAIIASLIIVTLSLNIENIWEDYSKNQFLRFIHVIAVFFDAYTSYLGTAQYIILRDTTSAFITIGFGDVWNNTSFEQKIILLFVTILVTISPMMFIKFSE